MRHPLLLSTLAFVGCASCVSYVRQYVAFGRAPVWPSVVPGEVGDVVTFQVRPEVPVGSKWSLQCRGRVRFADDTTVSSLDWTANPHAVRLETIISPWDPPPSSARTSRGWLSYGLREEGESSMLDRDLPIRRVAYRELAPVTFAATFAPGAEKPELSVSEHGGRVTVHYRTETSTGVPRQPLVDAMLLESGNRTILYAEVRTNFGTVPREPIGYDVTLSYDKARVSAPAEIIVAGWIGNGDYWKPFTVLRHRGSGGPSAPETTKPAPPASDVPAPKSAAPPG